jgi:uncharacterized protein
LREEGSDVADEVWDGAELAVSSRLVYPEARAALAAAKRDGRIDSRVLRRSVSDLNDLCEELRIVGLDAELARAAGEAAERYALRGYDAVHLASALSIEDEGLVVATWDDDLAEAGAAAGLIVVPAR